MSSSVQPDLIASFSTFGDFLKFLRRCAGLTQLELSIAVGYSEAQISRLEQNQRLPDLTALKALFIPALDLEHQPELTTRLLALAESARQEDAPLPGIAPYKGLLFFDEADAELFFGREELTARIVARVNALARGLPRLLTVVGASGSGKSSVMRAGLAVALKHAGWDVCVFTPTQHPLNVWNAVRNRWQLDISPHPFPIPRPGLVIIDQFEEIFTLCRDEDVRAEFIEKVLGTANEPNGRITMALALRADFYLHCAQYPPLRQAIAEHQEYIGQMTREELRRAIEEPAKRSGWEFEPGLVDLMLSDVGAGGAQDQEPGALPLLSHALLATWERRRGRMFTLAGYRAAGGVRSAIAETAESVFADQLNQQQQDLARDVFLRLTELGEGTEDTRRRTALTELVRSAEEAMQLRVVLDTLANARLVMLGEDSAEVAHEALIREWTRLRDWLNENREGLRLHRHLTESAESWQKLNREPGELYRGARLAQAMEWAESNKGELNPLEREFLEAARELKEQEEREREAQRQREMIAARKLAEAERRRANILRWVALGSSLLLVVMIGLAIFAFSQRTVAENARVEAVAQRDSAEQARADAEYQRQVAFSRELSVNAVNSLNVDPERSILLALQAVSVSSAGGKPVLREAQEALHRAVQSSRVQFALRSHTAAVWSVAFSPDERYLTTGSMDKMAKLWDAATGKELLTFSGHTDWVTGVAFSPDRTRLATASQDKTAKVWEVATGQILLTLSGHTDAIYGIAFSPDGRRIATGSLDKTAKIWDAATGKELVTLSGHTAEVFRGIAFSPDGSRLVTASVDKTAKIWDVATGKELLTLPGHTQAIYGIALSPDGRLVATASFDTTTKIWDATSGRLLINLPRPAAPAISVAFNRAGTRVASGYGDNVVIVWDVATGQMILDLRGHTSAVQGIAFSPDPQGMRLATASSDGTARVWNVTPAGVREWLTLADNAGRIRDVAYSADGKYLATTSDNKTAKLWDAATGQVVRTFGGHTDILRGVTISPDGQRLATISEDQTAKVWDAATGQALLTLPNPANAVGLPDHSITFSPDGTRLAVESAGNTAQVWDVLAGKELLTLSGHTRVIRDIAFSPDGRRIATVSDDRTAKVWDAITGSLLLTLSGHADAVFAVAFSSDGRRLATSGRDGVAKVWDIVAGQELQTLVGHSGNVFTIAFSPDGTRLATGSADSTIKIWNISTDAQLREEPFTLFGHEGSVFRVVFSPDGTRLASGSIDGTARVWALRFEDLLPIAKSRVTRTLTNDECQKYLHVDKCP